MVDYESYTQGLFDLDSSCLHRPLHNHRHGVVGSFDGVWLGVRRLATMQREQIYRRLVGTRSDRAIESIVYRGGSGGSDFVCFTFSKTHASQAGSDRLVDRACRRGFDASGHRRNRCLDGIESVFEHRTLHSFDLLNERRLHVGSACKNFQTDRRCGAAWRANPERWSTHQDCETSPSYYWRCCINGDTRYWLGATRW